MAALAAALLALATLAPLPSGYAQEGRPRGIPRPTDWSTFAAQLGLPEEGGQRPQLKLVEGDFPHLAIGSHPLHLIGWDLGGNLQVPQRDLIKQIETAEGVELPVVVIRVDLASISEAQNKRNLNKVKELANAAQNLQRWFILALELDWAPDWYLRSGVRTVQETNPSNLRQDREMDLVGPVPPGPVRQPGRGGQVAMADGAYLNLCKQVIEDLYYEFGRVDGTSEYGRFLGWILTPPSAPFLYRGLGRDDVSGFADYSAFSQARFNSWRNYWEEMARRETGMATTDVMAGGGPFTGTSAALWEEFTSPAPAQGPPGEVPGTAPTEEPDALAAPAVEPESPPGDQDPDRIQPTGGESQAPADPLAAPADGGAPEAAQGESSFDGADGVVAGFRNAIPDPLPPASKSGPDTRPIWLKWTQFRLLEQQIAVDRLGRHLRRLDQHHPIFATAWGALAYRENNGYEALAWGADPAWIARRPYIDGLVIPFELSSHSFAIPSGAGDSDNLHAARAMADLAQRYNKIPLLAVERSVTNPPAVGDLAALQQWCVAAGVDPIWSANGFFTRGSTWAKEEIRQFARGAPYAALPFPSQKPEPTVTVLDSPLLLGNNYCDGSPRLPRASHIPDILTGAGFDVEVLFPQEFPDIGGPTPPLGKVCFLLQEDLIQPRGFDQFTVGFQTAQKDQDAAARRRNMAGPVLEIMDDSELAIWQANGYGRKELRDNLVANLAQLQVRGRLRNGPPTLVEMNDTYVFYKSLASQLAPELNLADDLDPAAQHPSASQDYFNFHTGEPQSLTLANGYVHFHEVPGGPEGGPLLLGRMEKLTASREAYLHFHQTVMHNQHLARMRASLPALLLLTLCSVGLGVLFLYQLNMNRKGGIRLYLLRRRQAAAWAAMQGRHVSAAVGAGAKAVHRYQASGNGRRTPPRKSVPQGIRTKK